MRKIRWSEVKSFPKKAPLFMCPYCSEKIKPMQIFCLKCLKYIPEKYRSW